MRRPLVFHLTALVAGLIFGLGLAISGMTSPAKVKAFLDIGAMRSGGWDPSLAFVMAAAVIVTMAAVRIGHRRRQPLAAPSFSAPPARRIDARLVIGAAIFGIGWGLSGLCPGPAIADIVMAFPGILIFIVAMGLGATIVRLIGRSRGAAAAEDEGSI
ncbi:YeeE/YedE family protein [Kaistia dalseonensis]|uniref:Membrane protein YedE/YeeE n=1 Tax=Kaistia dalseonensis TaxID=410840 RepID=A0ABU0H2J9_9HYPH|nr:DUF6691 family protein [Kaistia dalseonensis]MCX5493961.1 YeeE/YedE family protein [Kaistia dalseonensis]MDQ0436537.1 putative membrane protein YedE/YeeE [Kaistia dalseonensis]